MIEDDYLRLRKLQKAAREEMWHVFSHHPELEKEWNRDTGAWGPGGCLSEIKALLEWEPDD